MDVCAEEMVVMIEETIEEKRKRTTETGRER